jgi:hypothetical protein
VWGGMTKPTLQWTDTPSPVAILGGVDAADSEARVGDGRVYTAIYLWDDRRKDREKHRYVVTFCDERVSTRPITLGWDYTEKRAKNRAQRHFDEAEAIGLV